MPLVLLELGARVPALILLLAFMVPVSGSPERTQCENWEGCAKQEGIK